MTDFGEPARTSHISKMVLSIGKFGGPSGIRTQDRRIKSQWLQLQNSPKTASKNRETAGKQLKTAGKRQVSGHLPDTKWQQWQHLKKGGNAGLRPKKHTCANITTYSCRSGSDGRGPPNGAWRHRRITGLISNPKQRRISQLAHLASPLLCAACAPPCAGPHAPRPRDGCRVMPQRGIPFGNVNSAVTRKPNRS